MDNKKPTGILIIGWIIIASNSIELLNYIGILLFKFSFVKKFQLIHSVYSIESNLFTSTYLTFYSPIPIIIRIILLVLLILCGVALLDKINHARIIIISVSCLEIVDYLFRSYGYTINNWGENNLYYSFSIYSFLIIFIIPLLIRALYIYYLSTPKIKEQFK